jgi:hypothetical protein
MPLARASRPVLSLGATVNAPERRGVGPGADLVGNEIDPPQIACGRAGLRGIAVGGIVTGHDIDLVAMTESHVEPVVEERVELGGFAGLRAGEGQLDVMPLLAFAIDPHG